MTVSTIPGTDTAPTGHARLLAWIREVAELVMRVVGAEGSIIFDPSKPDGVPRKLLDSTRLLSMGWKPRTDLETGLRKAYSWYLENAA